MQMEPRNRLALMCQQMGIAQVTPNDAQLEKWGMSRTRFNQIVANNGRVNIRVKEANDLRAWLQEHFAKRYHYLFEDEVPAHLQAGKQETLALH